MFRLKTNIASISVVAISIGALIIGGLTLYSTETKYRGGGFHRSFFQELSLVPIDTIGLDPKNHHYLAGSTTSAIMLGSLTYPAVVLCIQKDLRDTSTFKIKYDRKLSLVVRAVRIAIDSPYFFLTDGASRVILKGTITDGNVTEEISSQEYFTDFYPISSSSAILRSLSRSRTNIFGKFNFRTGRTLFDTTILTKQIDGLFCTNGSLNVDQSNRRLVFVYNYRNEFIVMDTSLENVWHGKTIDTTAQAKIKVSDNSSNNYYLASPPALVNRAITVYRDLLLVNSELLADNELLETIKNQSAIDVYDLTSRTYSGSFYIPTFQGKKFSEMLILPDETLLVVYPDGLIRWSICGFLEKYRS